jgi:hypothetical protein
MHKNIEILLVVLYNLALFAGASYLVVEHNVTAWVYFVALCFGASWNIKMKKDEA